MIIYLSRTSAQSSWLMRIASETNEAMFFYNPQLNNRGQLCWSVDGSSYHSADVLAARKGYKVNSAWECFSIAKDRGINVLAPLWADFILNDLAVSKMSSEELYLRILASV